MKLCWHKWSKWSVPTDGYDGKYQHAICNKCGALINRKLKYDGSTPSKAIYLKFKNWFIEDNG